MARLTSKARNTLPAGDFAGPHKSFPIPDKGHAKAALGLIGHAPAAARPNIRARAKAMLDNPIHPNAHPGPGWNTTKAHHARHSAKSMKSGKFT